jgi:hypothetical protein
MIPAIAFYGRTGVQGIYINKCRPVRHPSVRYRNEQKRRCRNKSGTGLRYRMSECRCRRHQPRCQCRRHRPRCQCPAMEISYAAWPTGTTLALSRLNLGLKRWLLYSEERGKILEGLRKREKERGEEGTSRQKGKSGEMVAAPGREILASRVTSLAQWSFPASHHFLPYLYTLTRLLRISLTHHALHPLSHSIAIWMSITDLHAQSIPSKNFQCFLEDVIIPYFPSK